MFALRSETGLGFIRDLDIIMSTLFMIINLLLIAVNMYFYLKFGVKVTAGK